LVEPITGRKVPSDGSDLFGFHLPLFIKIGKQAQDDSFTAFGVLEITHNLQTPSHFLKASFDDVGGPDDFMKLRIKLKERNEFIEIRMNAYAFFKRYLSSLVLKLILWR
jgi:hypothetical protein